MKPGWHVPHPCPGTSPSLQTCFVALCRLYRVLQPGWASFRSGSAFPELWRKGSRRWGGYSAVGLEPQGGATRIEWLFLTDPSPHPPLFLVLGDLFSLRESLALSIASLLSQRSWPFSQKEECGAVSSQRTCQDDSEEDAQQVPWLLICIHLLMLSTYIEPAGGKAEIQVQPCHLRDVSSPQVI